MDVLQFGSMLATSSIWFVHVPELEDQFEGSYPIPTAERLRIVNRTTTRGEMPPKIFEEYSKELAPRTEGYLRDSAYVNCWYSGRYESAALWQWAARKGASVAIRTTVRKLIESLQWPESIFIGEVSYINYNKHDPAGDPLSICFCKRRSYEHEREVRLLIDRTTSAARPKEGMSISVQLKDLVERVIVEPLAEDWVIDAVRSLVRVYGLDVPVERSQLDTPPLYG
jgi:hypothetical protein